MGPILGLIHPNVLFGDILYPFVSVSVAIILFDLVGDGNKKGIYSKYIDSINHDSNYMLNHINRLFTYELRSLFNQLDHSEKEFLIQEIPIEVKDHLMNDNLYKIRYFID